MARNKYRVKHYYGDKEGFYRAKPRPVTVIFIVLLLAGFVYLGTVIYQPVYDFVMNVGKLPDSETPASESLLPETPSAAESAPEPKPEPEPPKPAPVKLRAAYITPDMAADPVKLDAFIASIKGAALNAVMIDIKNSEGYLLYKSSNAQAQKWNLIASGAIDLKAFAQKLEENGLYLVVRMCAFRDPKAASAGRMDYAISYQNSDFLWLDAASEKGGRPWLNPYSMLTQDYLEYIALEAVDAGAKLVVFENIQFPDNSAVYATFGRNAVAMSRSEILKSFLSSAGKLVEEKGARVAAYYTTLEGTLEESIAENRYGGSPFKIENGLIAVNVSPSQFRGDYSGRDLRIVKPLADPADAVTACLDYVKRTAGGAEIIPVLQGGNDMPFNEKMPYTAEQAAAQIKAAEAFGAQEYILYNANAQYLIK